MIRKRIRSSTPGSVSGGEIIIVAGDSDQNILIGTENHDDNFQSGVLSAQSLGQENEAMGPYQGNLTREAGQQAEAMAQTETGVETASVGSENESLAFQNGSLIVPSLGGQNDSWQADSVINAQDNSTTQTSVDIAPAGGDATWQNPTNAASLNASEAQITRTGQLTAATAFSDELRLQTFTPGGPPSGWTQTLANLLVTHRWQILNPALDLLSTADYQLVVRYTDATEDVLKTLTQASADQGTLITETYDISARVITQGKTLDRVMFRAIANIALAQTGTTKSWSVDAGRLEYRFTRTGIN